MSPGQRLYGPPPNWTGNKPGKGCEVRVLSNFSTCSVLTGFTYCALDNIVCVSEVISRLWLSR